MRTRTALIASIATGAVGVGLALWGVAGGISLAVRGDLLGGAAIELPSLMPIVAVVGGVVLAIVALLLLLMPGRDREPDATLAVAAVVNAPLLVEESADEVTFVWGDTGTATSTPPRTGSPGA